MPSPFQVVGNLKTLENAHNARISCLGVADDGHVLLLDIVQLNLPCGCVDCEDLFEVPPCLFWRFGLSDVGKDVIMNA